MNQYLNCENYPIVLEPYNPVIRDGIHLLRQKENRMFNDSCRLQKSKMSFNVDAASLWNAAPMSIQNAVSNYEAKKYINEFVKTLPL